MGLCRNGGCEVFGGGESLSEEGLFDSQSGPRCASIKFLILK